MPVQRQQDYLKRKLGRWQIFFIALGGVIGIGFFEGSSTSLGISGPAGALIAVVTVGCVATAVMECICELIVLWPIPNAMVEYVRTFVDEDLGVAVGIMYWYTYCVNFSALIIAATDLTNYRSVNEAFKVLVYVLAPFLLMIINAFPVEVFGWIEFVGGILKLALVAGTIVLMFVINGAVNPDKTRIGTRYFVDGTAYNPHVASATYEAVFEAIPLATFAYIGVELLTTTAFEALKPGELRLPAANIAWFSTLLYGLATGSFVSNVFWKDQNLPALFQQALATITDPELKRQYQAFAPPQPEMQAAPLIALYQVGYRVLPSFLNGCFIYSALSCANTALYVASRQLYGLTRSITVDRNSGVARRFLYWMSTVHPTTLTPWPAVAISAFLLCWLPFIKIHNGNNKYLEDVQDSLIAVGSVSCILMWCAQCVAYIRFYHLREHHRDPLMERGTTWQKLFDKNKGGWLKVFQPFFGYFGAICTILIVFFFNTVSLWNGERIGVKASSAFISPALVFSIWLVKKLTRTDGGRFRFGVNLSNFNHYEMSLQRLEDLIYPGEDTSQVYLPLKPLHRRHLRLVSNDSHNALQQNNGPEELHEAWDQGPPQAYNRADIIITPSPDAVQDAPAEPQFGDHHSTGSAYVTASQHDEV